MVNQDSHVCHRSIFALCVMLAGAMLLAATWSAEASIGTAATSQRAGGTPTATPSCELYSYSLSPGTMIGGTNDIGNHCDFCGTTITLPFPVTLYGQSFITATAVSKGNLAFGTAYTAFLVECLPFSPATYVMAPFWVDQVTYTAFCSGCGIFTSTVGTAPNRTFVVEWRTIYFGQHNSSPTLNFEIQLHEGQSTFKYAYGLVTSYEDADTALTIGVQLSRNSNTFTEYYCDPTGETAPALSGQHLTWTFDPCGTPTVVPTFVATATDTPAPSATATGTSTAVAPTHTPTTIPSASPATSVPTDTVPPTLTSTPTSISTVTDTPSATGTPEASPTSKITPTACTIQFTDVEPGSSFYDNIRCLACRGIINGYTGGCDTGSPCFKPGNLVTRGQLSKIVVNAAMFLEPVGDQQFEDVPAGSTFFEFVWRLADRGIVNGYPCGGPGEPCVGGGLSYFRPNANITRGQISKIVSEAAGLSQTASGQQFEDVPENSTFYVWIWRLVDKGVMNGYPCGGVGEPCGTGSLPYFRSGANATRGQASKIVANTFFHKCQPGYQH